MSRRCNRSTAWYHRQKAHNRQIMAKHKLDTANPHWADTTLWTSQQNHEARLRTYRSGAFMLPMVFSGRDSRSEEDEHHLKPLKGIFFEDSLNAGSFWWREKEEEGKRGQAWRSAFVSVARPPSRAVNPRRSAVPLS